MATGASRPLGRPDEVAQLVVDRSGQLGDALPHPRGDGPAKRGLRSDRVAARDRTERQPRRGPEAVERIELSM